ncbi:12010_t:CDS:1, partial [Acaulospora morrowiae]
DRLPNEPNPTFSTNHNNKKPQKCIARYWSTVFDLNAWSSCLYLLLISPVISSFAFFWVFFTFIGVVISLIFPPVGFFLGIVTVWSWRALGRLEILTVQLCTIATHKSPYLTKSRFHHIIHLPSSGGLLTYG